MGNRLYIGEKHNGYEIDEESKKIIVHKCNSLYENVVKKIEKNVEIQINDIDFISITYSAHDAGLWGLNSMLVLIAHLKDGQCIQFHGKIEANKDDFLKAYHLLKKMEVQFKDKYNIVDYFLNSKESRIDYILNEMMNKKILESHLY